MRVGRVLWPRSPTTPSWGRTSTVPGMCLRTVFDLSGLPTVLVPTQHTQPLLPFLGSHRGGQRTLAAEEALTAIVFGLWQSRCPTTHLYQASTASARRRGCVSTLMSGPRASSWAWLLESPWLGKVRDHVLQMSVNICQYVNIFLTLKSFICLVLSCPVQCTWRKSVSRDQQGSQIQITSWKVR